MRRLTVTDFDIDGYPQSERSHGFNGGLPGSLCGEYGGAESRGGERWKERKEWES